MQVLESKEFVEEDGAPAQPAKPRVLTLLAALLVAAATFSYLGAFCVTDALARAELIHPIPRDHDPRWRWALISFAAILIVYLIGAAALRFMGGRQLANTEDSTDA